jgi:hypothetical protein
MSDLNTWNVVTPERNVYVMAAYSLDEKLRLVKTCKHGCCVYDPYIMDNLILPRYWRLPTEQELQSVSVPKTSTITNDNKEVI